MVRITADFSGDPRNPVSIIQAMTDPAALEYVAKNASMDYIQDLAKERLSFLKK